MQSVQQVNIFSTGKEKTKAGISDAINVLTWWHRTVLIANKNKQNPDALQCNTSAVTVCGELENSLNEKV